MLVENSNISILPFLSRRDGKLFVGTDSTAMTNYGTVTRVAIGEEIELLSAGINDAIGAVHVCRLVARDQEIYFRR